MHVHFLNLALDRWDEVSGQALVLSVFDDERPLRGAAGLADWRLCGRLSHLIKRGRVAGETNETLMMPPGRRLSFERVILFGLGASRGFTEDVYRRTVRWIRDVVERAGVQTYALQPPGRALGLIAARRALELWLDRAQMDGYDTDVRIIDTPGAQKEMAETLRHRQRAIARETAASQ